MGGKTQVEQLGVFPRDVDPLCVSEGSEGILSHKQTSGGMNCTGHV